MLGKRHLNLSTPKDNLASDKSISNIAPTQSPDDIRRMNNNNNNATYSNRSNRGTSVSSFNLNVGKRGNFEPSKSAPLGMRCLVTANDPDFNNVHGRYRFMFTTLEERARSLDKHLLRIQEDICKRYEITEIQPVGIPCQDLVWVCGRIYCEAAEGQINKTSVQLEGSLKESCGRRVHLDLSEYENQSFALFPGQIVFVQGINSSGRKMIVKHIIEGIPRPRMCTSLTQLRKYHTSPYYQNNQPLSLFMASGPFTTSDNLLYEPLEDLLRQVLNKKPDILILIGPFVDISQPLLAGDDDIILDDVDDDKNILSQHCASYEMIFIEKIIRDGLKALFNSESDHGNIITNIIIIPSLKDAHHEYVYPQPPFGDRDRLDTIFFDEALGVLDVPYSKENDPLKRVHLFSNPSMFR